MNAACACAAKAASEQPQQAAPSMNGAPGSSYEGKEAAAASELSDPAPCSTPPAPAEPSGAALMGKSWKCMPTLMAFSSRGRAAPLHALRGWDHAGARPTHMMLSYPQVPGAGCNLRSNAVPARQS